MKYGGLKFLEAAHVRDLLALLRVLDNPYDELAWFRVLQLVDGVGSATVRAVVAAAGYPPFVEVPEQAEPDGTFPTVAFPNPEEPGAMDLAYATADAARADLVLVNKTDLLPYVDFDVAALAGRARALRPDVEVLPLSVRTGDGFEHWLGWLGRLAAPGTRGVPHGAAVGP